MVLMMMMMVMVMVMVMVDDDDDGDDDDDDGFYGGFYGGFYDDFHDALRFQIHQLEPLRRESKRRIGLGCRMISPNAIVEGGF